MTRRRKDAVRDQVRAQLERAKSWPAGFDAGTLRRWRTHHHVVTVRCAACFKPAWILMSPRERVTLDEIVQVTLDPAARLVSNACTCRWYVRPTGRDVHVGVARALRRGLGGVTEHRATTVTLSPPPADLFYQSPHGMWVRKSDAGNPCPYCDSQIGHPVPAEFC